MLRITAYADRLERELEGLDWPEGIKHLQRNWIGRSTGAEVDFSIQFESVDFAAKCNRRHFFGDKQSRSDNKTASRVSRARRSLRIYTTRPDTLFGATYMVIAPEHPFVERLTTPSNGRRGPGVLRSRRPQERSRSH